MFMMVVIELAISTGCPKKRGFEKEMPEKIKHQVDNPSMHFFCALLHFHDLQLKQNLFHVQCY